MIGPGNYDDDCTAVRTSYNAVGVLLIVLDGDKGTGFSCQIPFELTARIPDLLRGMANDIEADLKKGTV